MHFTGSITANLSGISTSAHFVICIAKLRPHSVRAVACYSTWAVRSSWDERDCIHHVTCVEMSLESTGLGRICCPTVGVPVYTWILSFCTHTHTHSDARENPHIIGGKGFSLSLFSLFLSLSPSVLFLKSCNTGKICKPWSGNSGFSQWEHSVIPAGLCRRVNTFFSQARNSLAWRESAAEREGG